MRSFDRMAWAAAVAAAALLAAPAAQAVRSGLTPQGMAYVTGGVSDEELVDLRARRDAYTLWVVTAAARTGAHLADVRVVVRDARSRPVFDQKLDGPWLFIFLPRGRYEVQAMLNGEVHSRRTQIHKGDHHQVFFYFETGDDVGPEGRSPFASNPYAKLPPGD